MSKYHIELPDKDYDLILMEYKEIPLTQGKIALVDVEDYEWLMQWRWCANKNNSGLFYAISYRKNENKLTKMHRVIINTPKGMDTDHANGDGLDNRRCNLRICTKSQNSINKKIQSNNTSGYRGVYRVKSRKKCWRVGVEINNKRKTLGYFNTKEEAALVYNEAAKKHYGEFARLNNINFKGN